MKKLFLISALMFSFNGWTQSNFDGSITCFNTSKEIIDLDNVSIDDENLHSTRDNKFIEYSYKDFFRNKKNGRISIASGTTCNIIYHTSEGGSGKGWTCPTGIPNCLPELVDEPNLLPELE